VAEWVVKRLFWAVKVVVLLGLLEVALVEDSCLILVPSECAD
jgi:hypothetical protein